MITIAYEEQDECYKIASCSAKTGNNDFTRGSNVIFDNSCMELDKYIYNNAKTSKDIELFGFRNSDETFDIKEFEISTELCEKFGLNYY